MENYIGRVLAKNEIVHHINHNPYDCRLCNLKLMTKEEHKAIHEIEQESLYIIFVCPECKNIFIKKIWNGYIYDKKKKQHNIFCSRSCNGKHGRKNQLKMNVDNIDIEHQIISVGYLTKAEYLKRIAEKDFSQLRNNKLFPSIHPKEIILDETTIEIIGCSV